MAEVLEQPKTEALRTVMNARRLQALRRLGLLDTPAETAFDKLGELAGKLLRAPIALVTLIDEDRQFFKCCIGLPEPWSIWRQTPLSHSFCQHVVDRGAPLIISDARLNPLVRDNPGVTDLGVIAYLGIPLKLSSGEILGSFCVIDHVPRLWSADEIGTMVSLTQFAITELELRSEMAHRKEASDCVHQLNAELAEKAERLERLNKDLEAFGYTVSHDLRGPVSRISMFAQLLREGPAKQEADRYLLAIARNCDDATHVIEGVLRLTGLSRQQIKREPLNLSEMVSNILMEFHSRSPERKIRAEIAPNVWAQADRNLIHLGLENLLGNAWKFTAHAAEPCIEFGTHEEHDVTVYFVRDNGIGFEPEQAKKLFIPFSKLTKPGEYAGLGIGLGTVRKVVEMHGGKAWAEGQLGRGATFFFTLQSS